MAAGSVSLTGDKELTKLLDSLDGKVQRRIASKTFRASAKRLRVKIASAAPVNQGVLKKAMTRAKIRKSPGTKRGTVRIGIRMPTREELGIPSKDKGYYPFSLEYGFKKRGGGNVAPVRYLRGTVDKETASETDAIASDIGKFIEVEARKSHAKGKK